MGTGTSQGVPMIAFDHHHCDLSDPRNHRSRTSAHVVMDGHHIQIDAGPEFRAQCLANDIRSIDTFILTHGHADHVLGMDDLRRFCDQRGGDALDVYTSEEGEERVRAIFPYAVGEKARFKGYAAFRLHRMPEVLELPGGWVRSCSLPHGRIEVLGLVFEEKSSGRRLAYYTDCKEVGAEARKIAREVDVLVIDGLRPEPHPTHLCIDEALAVAADLGARKTYLTHLTHHVDHAKVSAGLPAGVCLPYDGLRVEV
ncbi:MAG: MBL fold metallo-hydrolase [Candidatus Methylacidiphilales bacterium]|nr:MBL fold metallo-hydrolase [Candidatus Methylacidiphilales bacterium]